LNFLISSAEPSEAATGDAGGDEETCRLAEDSFDASQQDSEGFLDSRLDSIRGS
jgi:hypothetical protein